MLIVCKKNADISKIKNTLVLKGIFYETTMCLYLRTKFEVCSIILTSFRQGWRGNFNPTTSKRTLKSPPRLGLRELFPRKEEIKNETEILDQIRNVQSLFLNSSKKIKLEVNGFLITFNTLKLFEAQINACDPINAKTYTIQ